MTRDEHEAPVLLIRTGLNEVTAVMNRDTPAGWRRLVGSTLAFLAPLIEGGQMSDTGHLSARTFILRPEDEAVWDLHRKYGTGGYAYGVLVGPDGKFVKNVAVKEVTAPPNRSAAGSPRLDPSAIATALAMAQIQASIQHLTGLVEQIGHDVKSISNMLQLEQEADVLAAVEAVDETYRRFLVTGHSTSVDWDEIAPLGQVFKKQHRQILGELSSLPKVLAFQSVSDAKAVGRLDPQRISGLANLEYFLLRALSRWVELKLAAKISRGELQSEDADLAQQSMARYISSIHDVLLQIYRAEGNYRGRRWWEQLLTNGLLVGHINDEIYQDALERRKSIRSIAGHYSLLNGDLRTTLSSQTSAGEIAVEKNTVPANSSLES